MVEIQVEGQRLVFVVQGWDKLWALKSRLEIPIAHVLGVRADPEPAMGWFQGVKLGGTDLPNLFKAGSFYQDGGMVFWDVRHPEDTLVIDLDHERYKKLVIEVADPGAALRLIEQAIARARV